MSSFVETTSFPAFDEIAVLADSVASDLPREDPGRQTANLLTEVCDPDRRGDRHLFTGTPGCPPCASIEVETSTDTRQPWPRTARAATHAAWNDRDRSATGRVRVALALDATDTSA